MKNLDYLDDLVGQHILHCWNFKMLKENMSESAAARLTFSNHYVSQNRDGP
jgi:hypothetical protein